MPPILFTVGGPHLNLNPNGRRGIPPTLCGAFPLPVTLRSLVGVTRDSTGASLGSCVVQLFRTDDDKLMEETTSDGSGNYTLSTVGLGQAYYLVAYKVGSPDRAGTTVNTLVGV